MKKVKPDFKKLGPRYGKIMKQLAAHVQSMAQQEISDLEKEGKVTFKIEDQDVTIELADVEITS